MFNASDAYYLLVNYDCYSQILLYLLRDILKMVTYIFYKVQLHTSNIDLDLDSFSSVATLGMWFFVVGALVHIKSLLDDFFESSNCKKRSKIDKNAQ